MAGQNPNLRVGFIVAGISVIAAFLSAPFYRKEGRTWKWACFLFLIVRPAVAVAVSFLVAESEGGIPEARMPLLALGHGPIYLTVKAACDVGALFGGCATMSFKS